MNDTTFSAVRMTIHLHGSESWHHKPLATEIVHRAHNAGLAGASIFHGVEGFGSSFVVHTGHLMSISDELPITIVIVDVPENIQAFLPILVGLIDHGMITLDEVTAIRYRTGR
jgi:uncharacterized protein